MTLRRPMPYLYAFFHLLYATLVVRYTISNEKNKNRENVAGNDYALCQP